MNERMKLLEAVAKAALDYYDRNACQHEDTHRGGFIWTICDSCGKKWADDEGGFVPYSDPEPIVNLRAVLDALPAQPPGETVTLAMWRNPVGGVLLSIAGTKDDQDGGRAWRRLGTVTLEVTP